MGIIKLMDDKLANKIAAGEVVERPLSIVKELVENSIDANSKNIYITLKNSGIDYISVVDDGCGMDKDDALLCFSRHASSKLTDDEMLFRIATLGFRGEALSSIAAVSHVSLETCDGNTSSKTLVEFGKITVQTESKYRKGSAFEVTKLFHNTPARLKYLSNLYSELAKIVGYVSKCCLANPNIGFKLMNDGKEIISTSGSGDFLRAVRDVYSIDIAKKLVELNVLSEDISASLHVAKPDFQRSNKNYINVFVNKRVINSPSITKAIVEAYSNYLPKNKYPFCIVNITIDPELIDVNIHPNKYEIKFSKHDEVISLISSEIKKFLTSTSHIVEVKSEERKLTNEIAKTLELTRIKPNIQSTYKYEDSINQLFVEEDCLDKPQDCSNHITEVLDVTKGYEKEVVCEDRVKCDTEYYEPIGQFDGTYILAQKRGELIMIDQHAAVERINYEKNLCNISKEEINVTELLVPITLEYSSDEAIIIRNKLSEIRDLKIDMNEFGTNSFIVRSVPSWVIQDSEKQVIELIVEKILNKESIAISDIIDDAMQSMSCKESLKANSKLSKTEMEYIIDNVFKCENPYHCPHGRPIILKFTLKEIEKMFMRIV